MITTGKREKYDGSWRIVLYETDTAGKSMPQLTKSSFDEDIDSFYQQREQDFAKLHGRLFANEISPLCFFMELTHMTVEDAAARMKLRKSAVRSHLEPAGFDRLNVATLKRYAQLFDIAVGDFFQFTRLTGECLVKVHHASGRLVTEIEISPQETNVTCPNP